MVSPHHVEVLVAGKQQRKRSQTVAIVHLELVFVEVVFLLFLPHFEHIEGNLKVVMEKQQSLQIYLLLHIS